MLDIVLPDDETIEDLQLNGLKLIQKKDDFRFGMDSVLLAYFADIRASDKVADLGCGNGILPLLLYGRKKGKEFYAIELMKDAADLARRNAALNHLTDIIHIINDDAGKAGDHIPACSIDAVICNPPYGEPSSALISPHSGKAAARSQNKETLDSFFSGAFHILKGKGKVFLVYPVTQMLSVMEKLQKHHLEPKRFRLIFPKISKSPNLVLIEAVKDAKPMLHPMPPLIIYDETNNLTNELKSVYHIT